MHTALPAILTVISHPRSSAEIWSGGFVGGSRSTHATGYSKSRIRARALPPRGPSSGRVKCVPKISSAYPAAGRCAWLVPGSLCWEWRGSDSHGKADACRDDSDGAWFNAEVAQLSLNVQHTVLRHQEKIAVVVHERLLLHIGIEHGTGAIAETPSLIVGSPWPPMVLRPWTNVVPCPGTEFARPHVKCVG